MPSRFKPQLVCVFVCLAGILAISVFHGSFGAGPYATVHGPLQQIGLRSDWRSIVARWTDPEFSALLFPVTSIPFRSMDLQKLTCTITC